MKEYSQPRWPNWLNYLGLGLLCANLSACAAVSLASSAVSLTATVVSTGVAVTATTINTGAAVVQGAVNVGSALASSGRTAAPQVDVSERID